MKQLTPRWILLVTITALTLYLTWLIFAPFTNVLLWSIVLTTIASPINKALRDRLRRPALAAFLTLLMVVIVVIIPMFFVGFTMAGHFTQAVDSVQHGVNHFFNPESPHLKWLQRHNVNVQKLLDVDALAAQIRSLSGSIASQTFGLLAMGLLAVVQALLILFTTYYMLRDGGSLLISARALVPLSPANKDLMIQNIKNIIAASLKGTVLIAAIQGALGGIGFLVLGLPSAVLWGVVMFFMSLVPVVGSSLVWGPAAIYLLVNGSPIKAIILVTWGAGVIAMVDNVLRPVLVGSQTRMHELVVFFSILGGMQLFGPLGIVMGPIVVAVALGLLKIFHESGTEEVVSDTRTPQL